MLSERASFVRRILWPLGDGISNEVSWLASKLVDVAFSGEPFFGSIGNIRWRGEVYFRNWVVFVFNLACLVSARCCLTVAVEGGSALSLSFCVVVGSRSGCANFGIPSSISGVLVNSFVLVWAYGVVSNEVS